MQLADKMFYLDGEVVLTNQEKQGKSLAKDKEGGMI